MVFRRVRRKLFVALLLFSCFFPRAINCQRRSEPEASQPTPIPAQVTPDAHKEEEDIEAGSHGLVFSNLNATNELRIHGYLQADGRFFPEDMSGRQWNDLLFRRLRPLAEGTLVHRFDFRFMPDFAQGNFVVQESFVQWTSIPLAQLEVGKFKAPIGLEVLRSDRDLTFVERSMASDLVPLRHLGAQLDGFLHYDAIDYSIGIVNSAEDGANATFQWGSSKDEVGRFFFKPFSASGHSWLQPLGAGIAASIGSNSGAPPRYATVGQQTFFSYNPGVIANGPHRRLSPQSSYFHGPVGILAEYVTSNSTLSVHGASQYLCHHGWELAASFVLTGERNRNSDFHPRHPISFAKGRRSPGAIELAVRHSGLSIDPRAFPLYASPSASAQGASETAAGLNWYLDRRTKFVADAEYTGFRGNGPSLLQMHPERVMMAELQLAF